MRLERQMEKYDTQVSQSVAQLNQTSEKVLTDFPVFDPQSDKYNEALATNAATVLKANLIVENGRPIASRVDPYQLFKSFSDVYTSGTQSGEVQGKKATASMLKNVDTTSSSPSIPGKRDTFLDSFDAEFK